MARRLHGVDCPVNAISRSSGISPSTGARSRFSNAILDWAGTPLTLRERRMIALMGELTDKPDWARKVFDEDIVAKWRAEALASNDEARPELALTQKAFDYCVDELRDYASQLATTQMIPATSADGLVVKSDTRIPADLRADLQAAAQSLEDVEDNEKDWHPHSDERVLDLVHPSLFPLLYGRSTVLPEGTVPLQNCDKFIGKGSVIPVPYWKDLEVDSFPVVYMQGSRVGEHFYSKKYQWLPCEVAFRREDKMEITSYINNLHPRAHYQLYGVLQDIISKTVSMWDACLSRSERSNIPPRDDANAYWIEPTEPRPRAENEEEELDSTDICELDDQWRNAHGTLVLPDLPHTYQARADRATTNRKSTVDLRKDFETQGLQVIVKLANIHLTPDKPNYEGGSWHIEGQLNEHICASAIYYYDSFNIGDSYLSFRECTEFRHLRDKPHEGEDYVHIERVYGIEQDGPAVQELGHVNTREGRLLAFPNVFQHRVEPFSLADKSKPGHRKILALFLVDPHIRIPSTANVPPQQKHWWRNMLYGLDRVASLPSDLAERTVKAGDELPIDMEEAKQIRLDLMEERKLFVQDVDKRFENTDTFSFCEH